MSTTDLYYGFGGGLGHITRYKAFCLTQKSEPILLTANKFASKVVSPDKLKLFPYEQISNVDCKQTLKLWIKSVIEDVKPDNFIIDSFPGGILGDLAGLEALNNIKCTYLARIIKPFEYEKRLSAPLPNFNEIYLLEPLDSLQTNCINRLRAKTGAVLNDLKLVYENAPRKFINLKNRSEQQWLVVHSGTREEVNKLLNKVIKLRNSEPCPENINIIAATQFLHHELLFEKLTYVNKYPVRSLMESSDKIFSGAGFNAVMETEAIKERSWLMPFERALDDQLLRIKLNKRNILI